MEPRKSPQTITVSVTLLIRFFGDEAVAYNEVSAETHLLSVAGGRVLEALLSGCSDIATLESILVENLTKSDETDADQLLPGFIDEFERLGFIECQG
jgi:PqqD family protein of HPr-rel-A system